MENSQYTRNKRRRKVDSQIIEAEEAIPHLICLFGALVLAAGRDTESDIFSGLRTDFLFSVPQYGQYGSDRLMKRLHLAQVDLGVDWIIKSSYSFIGVVYIRYHLSRKK